MKVTSLDLINFRNHASTSIKLCSGFNLLVGLNGQGKTNLAEALVFLSRAKSPRTHQDKDLIRSGENFANIKAELIKKYGKVAFDFTINSEADNVFDINYNHIDKIGDVFGNLVCIYFCPQDLKIITGGPSERRDFIDTDITMLSSTYYNLLNRYDKVLSQRNKLLKTEKNFEKLLETLDVWNEQLALIATPIIKTRRAFIEKLSPVAESFLNQISDNQEQLKITYVGSLGVTKEEIKSRLLSDLEDNIEKDVEVGYTTIGPHRDDIKIELNGLDARAFSSQGQARSIVLALKLAEMKIMADELNEEPIMIFDDIFSELDFKRQKKLYNVLNGVQTIFTGTNFKFKPEHFTQFKIVDGKVKSKIEK